MKTMHLYRNLGMVAVGMMSMLATSCEEEIDNYCCPIKLDNNKNSVLDC